MVDRSSMNLNSMSENKAPNYKRKLFSLNISLKEKLIFIIMKTAISGGIFTILRPLSRNSLFTKHTISTKEV